MFLKGLGIHLNASLLRRVLTYFLGGGRQPKGQRTSLGFSTFLGIALHSSTCPSRKVYDKLGSKFEKLAIPLLGIAFSFSTRFSIVLTYRKTSGEI